VKKVKRNILALLSVIFAVNGLCAQQGGAISLTDSLKFIENYPLEIRPTVYYTEGVACATQEQLSEAIDWFTLALSLNPDHAPSLYETANALAKLGDPAKALEYSRRAADIDPNNEWYRTQKARLLVSTRQYEEALPLFESMLDGKRKTFDPNNFRILALIYYQLKQPDKALSTLDSAEVRLGQNPDLVDLKRSFLLEQGRVDEAVDFTKKYLTQNPYDEQNRLALADLYDYLGQDSLRMTTLKEVLEIDPDNEIALGSLADYYYKQNSPALFFATIRQLFLLNEVLLKNKIDYFERLVRNWNFTRQYYAEMNDLALLLVTRYPGDPDVVEMYAGHLIRSGNVEEAAEILKTLLAQSTPSLSAFMQIIGLESHLKRSDSVARYNALALQHYPREVDLYLQKSYIEQTAEKFKEARVTLKKALAIADTNEAKSVITGAIGTLWHQQGKDSRAFREYDKALTYNPDNDHVLNNYAYFLAEKGMRLDKAFEMSSRAVGLVENSATYLDTYAWVLYKLGRFTEARGVMKRALPLDKDGSAELLIHYGDILYALGEEFLAQNYWKRAQEAGYDPAEVAKRVAQIK
jgi:tetratricopeptide (TPR) repeat protein